MSHYNNQTYRTKRAAQLRSRLLMILGSKCTYCPATENLTFDCIKPTGDAHHRMNPLDRMHFYFNECRRGNVQVLCWNCNVRKGARPQPPYTKCDSHAS